MGNEMNADSEVEDLLRIKFDFIKNDKHGINAKTYSWFLWDLDVLTQEVATQLELNKKNKEDKSSKVIELNVVAEKEGSFEIYIQMVADFMGISRGIVEGIIVCFLYDVLKKGFQERKTIYEAISNNLRDLSNGGALWAFSLIQKLEVLSNNETKEGKKIAKKRSKLYKNLANDKAIKSVEYTTKYTKKTVLRENFPDYFVENDDVENVYKTTTFNWIVKLIGLNFKDRRKWVFEQKNDDEKAISFSASIGDDDFWANVKSHKESFKEGMFFEATVLMEQEGLKKPTYKIQHLEDIRS